MPAWDEYVTMARERGALALELYVAESSPGADPNAVPAHLPAHLEYQRDLEAAGKLVLAGPLSDDAGGQMQGVGLIIYRAASLEEARAIAEADPMHASGARTFRLRRWLVNEGSLDLSVGLSTGKAVLR
ncbi:MAG: hypothetical protein GKR94_20270 [Gammaproteobacteria bacterium]|nr:hypothetical protein [Gammaproteobacteria bacterium]